ncbi:hypothetical protein INT43_009012 [Umbelopsis isabellina]|uniref:CHHC U11-48K-type domain-containing protein n=1 Tax=Mortierella isabellina TaxID=91625 RepID=A0A8H7PXT2_MORIS|nr:hypothetical protein INT43_009012 [Umbelopsis isabellina]
MDTAAVLNTLRQDGKEISQQIDHLLTELELDRDTLLTWYKNNSTVRTCPFNRSHIVPSTSLKSHCETCQQIRMVDTQAKYQTPTSSLPFYTHSSRVISFVADHALWKERTRANLQQLHDNATYDQLAQTRRSDNNEPSNTAIPDLVEHEKQRRERDRRAQKSRQEILAEERDYKRRRKTWRTKNVRSKAIDIQHDLVEGYMKDLELLSHGSRK